jgi:carotenoid cleavage dioxygenase-like enzyme
VSAHPKEDKKTGEYLVFGYDFFDMFNYNQGKVLYSLFDKDRKLVLRHEIPISGKRLIHDYAITQNYVIIPDLPMEFRPDLTALKSKFLFQFDKTKPSRYGILKRLAKNQKEIKWFEFPAHMVFHFINAWEHKNEKG